MKERRHKRLADMRARLGGCCTKCGTVDTLEFDHINPKTKTGLVSSAQMLDGPMARLIEEVDKCQLLCHDCHLEKSKAEGSVIGGRNKIVNPAHGTSKMYHYHKCKCDLCLEWKRQYRAKLVDSLGRPCQPWNNKKQLK